jgi:hypothetical protein
MSADTSRVDCALVRDALLSGSFSEISRDKIQEHLHVHPACAQWASQLLFLSHTLAIGHRQPEESGGIEDSQLECYLNGTLTDVDRDRVEDACCRDLHLAGRLSRLQARRLQQQVTELAGHIEQAAISLGSSALPMTAKGPLLSRKRALMAPKTKYRIIQVAGLICGCAICFFVFLQFRGPSTSTVAVTVNASPAYNPSVETVVTEDNKNAQPASSLATHQPRPPSRINDEHEQLPQETALKSHELRRAEATGIAAKRRDTLMRAIDERSELRSRDVSQSGLGIARRRSPELDHDTSQPQGQIFLPPAVGGTSASFQIQAEAEYIAAQGAFLESAAIARKINADAVAKDIQNSVEYVDAYFKRKELNKEWREKRQWPERVTYLEHEKKMKEVMGLRIDQYFTDTLKGDVTKALNYLLQNLYFVQYMSPGELKPLDTPLSNEQLKQIWLTDGGPGNNRLAFNLGSGEMLKNPWPYVLRGPDFAAQRNEFELSRDALVKEIREKGQAGTENGERVRKSVIQMWQTLEEAYPIERRREPAEFLEYSAAKGFLQSMLVQVAGALKTNDSSVFSDSLDFKGETLLSLLQHMSKMGLTFDQHRPGGEAVYKALFMNMRELYLERAPAKEL